MKRLPAIVFLSALGGCGDIGPSEQAADAASAVATLPSDRFELACRPGKPEALLPDFAKQGFRVRVDPKTRKYEFSHWSGDMPIQALEPTKIVFRDEDIERGRSHNPESWNVSYDLPSKTFRYSESYSGIIHYNYSFSSECEIAGAAA